MATTTTTIKMRYRSLDGYSKSATFKTLAGAKRFADKWVGKTPEVSSLGYAVDAYGMGKVTWEGCTAADLWPGMVF